MTVSAADVAVAVRDRIPGLPTKKLHKLLYYCQGHHLATFGKPLFADTISAWDMGPVVGSFWYAEKNGRVGEGRGELTEAELNTIGYVVSRYGALTGRDLENLTHSEDPWRRADGLRRPGESRRIELEWIEEYFRVNGTEDESGVVLDSEAVADWLRDARPRETAQPDSIEEIQRRLTTGA